MNMLIHITNREPLMREIIYDMMDRLTEDYEQNVFRRDLLITIPNIAIGSINGLAGVRQEWLVAAIGMEPNGIRGHNTLRAVKIRFSRAYRRLPENIHETLGRVAFFPVYGDGDNRIHRMNEVLAQYISDWALEQAPEGWHEWIVQMDEHIGGHLLEVFENFVVLEEE